MEEQPLVSQGVLTEGVLPPLFVPLAALKPHSAGSESVPSTWVYQRWS